MKFVWLIGVGLLIPGVSQAAVTISEVTWMGSSVSANAEWIELHNNGSNSVDVTGWTLSDGMNLDIELAGAVGAGQFVVLERTSDDSAPGSAFLIYTGALVNSGATLTLRNEAGSIQDQVAGGENWDNIGGDNTTKETAQYTGSTWITAAATPGRANAVVDSASNDVEEKAEANPTSQSKSSTKTSKSSNKVSKKSELVLPEATLELELTAPVRGYVHQPIDFSMEASGLGEGLLDSLKYRWNWGDGRTAGGQEPSHRYDYAGTYVVVVEASYARHTALVRQEITILPVTFSITRTGSGDIQINNNAKYEIDLSGYQLLAGKTFTFPLHTMLLANGTITIAREQLGGLTETVALRDPRGEVVASVVGPSVSLASRSSNLSQAAVAPPTQLAKAAPTENFNFDSAAVTSIEKTEPEIMTATSANRPPAVAAAAATAGGLPKAAWPYLALIALLGVAIAGVLVSKPVNEDTSLDV